MSDLEILIGLIAVAVLFVRLADLVAIPYPIVLVLVGVTIAAVSGASGTEVPPEVIFLLFLPPLLFSAALFTSPRELRDEAGALGGLVVGLSIVTMIAVAAVAQAVIPELNWTEALLLGAIVAPTDPVAAIATFERIGVPQRVARLVEGESMVNDATALVIYRVLVIAVVEGSFTVHVAVSELVVGVIGGVAIGLVIGWLGVRMQRRLDDPPLSALLSVVIAYGAYLTAEHVGASGVLSVVSAGILMGWLSRSQLDAETRLNADSFWRTFVFALNVIIFVLLGLKLPGIVEAVPSHIGLDEMIGYGVVVSLAVILVRIGWQFGPVAIGRLFSPALRFDTGEGWRERLIVGWSGMRGAVSLAAALSLPLTLDGGADFTNRETLIFLTVAVILATLVLQDLTLPVLIRRIGLTADEPWSDAEAGVRIAVTEIALERLEELEEERPDVPDSVIDAFRRRYERRLAVLRTSRARGDHPADAHEAVRIAPEIRRELIAAEREELQRQRGAGEIELELYREMERELDLDETRLPNYSGD